MDHIFGTFAVAFVMATALIKYLESRSKLALKRETDPARLETITANLDRQSHGVAALGLAAAVAAAVAWIVQSA